MFGAIKRFIRRAFGLKYDAAQTTPENRKHWANADSLGPRAANCPATRKKLRERARYETENNSYAAGIIQTLGNDVIGTGPRLQMQTDNEAFNEFIEREWSLWCKKILFAAKLRTMRETQARDGEGIALLTYNPKLPTPVKLDVRLIESEQVDSPLGTYDREHIDGIKHDQYGNPETYSILHEHPGDTGYTGKATPTPANVVIHIFRKIRPGQVRGVTEFAPSLGLFAVLRRWTLATIHAAEAVAAMGAGVVYTDGDPETEAGESAVPYEEIELTRGMLTVLPDKWKYTQAKAEQPTSTYSEVKHEVVNEATRAWSMPLNIALGNSSGYNYASGRLDQQTYYLARDIDKDDYELLAVDRVFEAWLEEGNKVVGYFPVRLLSFYDIPHEWHWDSRRHVDPSKEANATETELKNNTTTLADKWAEKGEDWETKLRQRAKEKALERELQITDAEAVPVPAKAAPAADAQDDEDAADA